ncbi:hypothetical protein BC826DRAFT_310925 [Russula brevipes]|nr:hypothetical protein BC826DRAFT_310925 [Russula brevipes]
MSTSQIDVDKVRRHDAQKVRRNIGRQEYGNQHCMRGTPCEVCRIMKSLKGVWPTSCPTGTLTSSEVPPAFVMWSLRSGIRRRRDASKCFWIWITPSIRAVFHSMLYRTSPRSPYLTRPVGQSSLININACSPEIPKLPKLENDRCQGDILAFRTPNLA